MARALLPAKTVSSKFTVGEAGGPSNHIAKPPARFPRSIRLLRHADFERVYKMGRRHFSPSFIAFFLARGEAEYETRQKSGQPTGQGTGVSGTGVTEAGITGGKTGSPGLRVGFTVGRALGNAVQRNRMKRRLREAVRLSRPPVSLCADVVINPKKSLLTDDFESVCNEVRRAFEMIEQKLTGKAGKNTV